MCYRIAQYSGRMAFADALCWQPAPSKTHQSGAWGPDRIPFYSLAPGLFPDVMHMLGGTRQFDTIRWSYRPAWAVEQGLPEQTHASIDRILSKPYYAGLMDRGRVIVPLDAWLEMTSDNGQPKTWRVRGKDESPLFVAAVTDWKEYTPHAEGTGFVMVSAGAGLVDSNDWRPAVLSPEDAASWIDPAVSTDRAAAIMRDRSVPPDAFSVSAVISQRSEGNTEA